MAITRTQIARQLYRIGGVGGRAEEGPVEKGGGGDKGGSDFGQFARRQQQNKALEGKGFLGKDLGMNIGEQDRLAKFGDLVKGGGITGMILSSLAGAFPSSGTTKPFITPDRGGSSQMDSSIPLWAQLGFNNEAEYLASLQAQETMDQETEVEEPFEVSRRFRADGGRIGFRGGDAARSDAASGRNAGRADPSGGVERGGGNRERRISEQYIKPPTVVGGGGEGPKQVIEKFPSTIRAIDKMNLDRMIANMNLNTVTTEEEDDVNYPTSGSFLDPKLDEKKQAEIFQEFATGGRAGLAGGGMPYEGGIMDLESARQMYGLGKLVKKVTRSVKKIAKSPIGKAALLYAGGAGLGALGTGTGFSGFTANLMSPTTLFGSLKTTGQNLGLLKRLTNTADGIGMGLPKRIGPLSKLGIGSAITAASMLPLLGIGTGEESEEEAQAILDNSGIDIEALRANPQLARRFRAEGGSMNEPVAKKTMPLLDMDGKEMDLRAEGGFVPIGRMEKADDVPARLSKNEFVFTADAVRNAGDGDVDKGAEVMYNMMKNLESGGDVSEESQGLEGARKMFQTSQRLEEVL
jgi:hypothetical protein